MQTATKVLRILPSELRLETTLKCGQSFRWLRIPAPEPASIAFRGAFNDRVVTLVQTATQISYSSIFAEDFEGNDDTEEFLKDYLNLEVNLEELYKYWSSRDKHFSKVSKVFLGLRMLRQDPFENLLSFICSTNNNISRITQMVQNLCKHYGKHIAKVDDVEYYTFPKPEALQHKTLEQELRALGFGYRAKYIAATVQQLKIESSEHLYNLRHYPYDAAHEELTKLMGVGAKVADCVCLMSLDKHQAVPVDTHVMQIAQRDYKVRTKSATMTKAQYDQIKNFFIDLWGPYAGWAHSVLFVADLKAFENGTIDAWDDVDATVPKLEIKTESDQNIPDLVKEAKKSAPKNSAEPDDDVPRTPKSEKRVNDIEISPSFKRLWSPPDYPTEDWLGLGDYSPPRKKGRRKKYIVYIGK